MVSTNSKLPGARRSEQIGSPNVWRRCPSFPSAAARARRGASGGLSRVGHRTYPSTAGYTEHATGRADLRQPLPHRKDPAETRRRSRPSRRRPRSPGATQPLRSTPFGATSRGAASESASRTGRIRVSARASAPQRPSAHRPERRTPSVLRPPRACSSERGRRAAPARSCREPLAQR